MTHWLVITHERGKDKVAIDRLQTRGFQVYQPMVRESLTRRVPMFLSYLFVEQHPDWRMIGSQPGVRRMIYLAGSEASSAYPIPAMIDQPWIDRFRAEEARTEAVARGEPNHDIRIGDRVCLATDAYAANTWTVDGLDAQGRVEFLISAMGKLHKQTVPVEMLRRVG